MLMNLANHVAATRPNLADSQRAALLMGAAWSPRLRALRTVGKIPFARVAVRSAVAAMNASASVGPMVVGQQLFAPSGTRPELSTSDIVDPLQSAAQPGRTPQERENQRRSALLGSSTAVAAGVLLQRALNHSAYAERPMADLGRLLGMQLAVGGAAGVIVGVTEQALGQSGRRAVHDPKNGLILGGLIATAQTRALRRAAATLSVPASPHRTTKPA